MIPWLIGAVLAFKWMYDKGVLSNKKSPSKKPAPTAGKPAAKPGASPAAKPGVGEDYIPPEQMRTPPKPAERKPEPQTVPKSSSPPREKTKEEKRLALEDSLPTREGGRGSFDDVLEEESDPGVGQEEFEELRDQGYDKSESEDEES